MWSIRAIGVGALASGAIMGGSAQGLNPLGPPAATPGPEPRTPINLVNTPGDTNTLFRITEPGSYYLTGTIVADNAVHGIVISASEVRVDLNGFALRTTVITPGQEPLTAILVSPEQENIVILDGSATGWAECGLDLTHATGGIVENVIVSHCGSDGLRAGEAFVVRDCVSRDNSSIGIVVGEACRIVGNHCTSNGVGILLNGSNSRIESNSVASCQRTGISVSFTADNNLILGNSVIGTTLEDGIEFDIFTTGNLILNNTVIDNAGVGIDNGNSPNLNEAFGNVGFLNMQNFSAVSPFEMSPTNSTGAWSNLWR